MTYLAAAKKADDASKKAKLAFRDSANANDSLEHLATSVSLLSEAVAELARSIHRDRD